MLRDISRLLADIELTAVLMQWLLYLWDFWVIPARRELNAPSTRVVYTLYGATVQYDKPRPMR